MIPGDSELIINHALSSRENLSIAIKVGLAYPALKSRIISGFLNRLASDVVLDLENQWTAGVVSDNCFGVRIRRKTWPKEKSIGVASENIAGRKVFFYVTTLGNIAGNALLDVDLKIELDQQVDEGADDKNYAWWKYSTRHQNWDSEEALLALTEPGETEYWKRRLIQIAEIVASHFPD